MFRELVVAKERNREEINRDIAHAWYGAMLSRAKRIPKLKTLLMRDGQVKAQTPGQMRSVLESLGYKSVPMSEQAKRGTKYSQFRSNA